jgi:hypothetical protein
VGGNALEVVALGGQVGVAGGLVDEGGNVGGGDVEGRRDKAQGGGEGATLGEDAMDSAGKGLDGTKPARAAGVVNCSPSLPVLLVVHPEGHGVGENQLREWAPVGQNGAIGPAERYILGPELDSPGPGVPFGHSVGTRRLEAERKRQW